MNILAFDTALSAGSVALVSNGAVLATCDEPNAKSLAERLVPMVDKVLAEAGKAYTDLDRIAVTVGPGTFTGMRIGVATARAMSLAADVPLVGASTLEVMARQVANDHPSATDIHICFDARRKEVYCQSFRPLGESDVAPLSEPVACSYEVASGLLSGTSGVAAGNGVGLVETPATIQVLEGYTRLDACVLAGMAAARPMPDSVPEPLYLRAPDAKLPGGKEVGA